MALRTSLVDEPDAFLAHGAAEADAVDGVHRLLLVLHELTLAHHLACSDLPAHTHNIDVMTSHSL